MDNSVITDSFEQIGMYENETNSVPENTNIAASLNHLNIALSIDEYLTTIDLVDSDLLTNGLTS